MGERDFIKDLKKVTGQISTLDCRGEFLSRVNPEELNKARHDVVLNETCVALQKNVFPAVLKKLKKDLDLHDEIECMIINAMFFDAQEVETENVIVITSKYRPQDKISQVNKALFLRLNISKEGHPWSLYSANNEGGIEYLRHMSKKFFEKSFDEINNEAALAISASVYNNILGALPSSMKKEILGKLIGEDDYSNQYVNITNDFQDGHDQEGLNHNFL